MAGQHVVATSASATTVTYEGDTSLYDLIISQVTSAGVPTAYWTFKGSTDMRGGSGGNTFLWSHGIHKFPDGVHLALSISMKGILTIPGVSGDIVLTNPLGVSEAIGVVVKFNIVTGKAAWAKMVGGTSERGGTVGAVDGDSAGNMIMHASTCVTGTTAATDNYGVTCTGASSGYGACPAGFGRTCTKFISKLSSADGSEVWKTNIPTGVSVGPVRVAIDGSGYIAGTIKGSMTIGSTTYASPTKADNSFESSPIVIKFTGAGAFSWAKVVGLGNGYDMDLSQDNSVLVLMCTSGGSSTVDGKTFGAKPGAGGSNDAALGNFVVRLATTANGATALGQVIWAADMPFLRGVEVTHDNNHIAVYGQVSGMNAYTLTDAEGESTTLKSRGSYDVFVAKMKASDGTGVWAIDGGGDGMEYFHGMGMDSLGNILVSGYSRSKDFAFGATTMANTKHNSVTGGRSTSNTVMTIQLSSSGTLPSCLSSCTEGAPHVPTTGCFIDNWCVAEGAASPYYGKSCFSCSSSANKEEWTGPDLSTSCYINGECIANGAPRMVSAGYSMKASACEVCDITKSTSEWTILNKLPHGGYDYVKGKCAASSFSKSNVDMTAGGEDLTKAMTASTVVGAIGDALKSGGGGFPAAKTAYVGSVLQTLAKKSWAGNAIFDKYVAYFGSATWLDDYMLSALDGTGQFAGTLSAAHGDMAEARTEAVKKAAQDQILVNAVLCTVSSAKTSAAAWDLAYAYWTSDDASKAPWARANKRCQNYGTCMDPTTGELGTTGTAMANHKVLDAIAAGSAAAKKTNATYAATEETAEAYLQLEGAITIVYYQAAMRYAYKMDNDLSSSPATATAEHQGEGGAFWRVIAPVVHALDPLITAEIAAMYTMTNVPTGTGPLAAPQTWDHLMTYPHSSDVHMRLAFSRRLASLSRQMRTATA